MITVTFKGEALSASPLTVLSEAKRNSLYLRLLEALKTGDETQQYFAQYRSDTVFVYVSCVVMLSNSRFALPSISDGLESHLTAFLAWCDMFTNVAEINALYTALDALNKPGDPNLAPPENLTAEKKTS
jgi:hypothetical protein